MRIIAARNLRDFAADHPDAKASLERWLAVMGNARCATMAEVQSLFPSAKVLNGDRVRFEVSGGNCRLIAAFKLKNQLAFVKFIGTHAEYDRVDALTISSFRHSSDTMDIRPIRDGEDHRAALVEIERLWAFPDDSAENDKLDVLSTLVEDYERRRWPREACSPAEVLRYAVDEMGHSQAELAAIVGKTLASQLLNGARRVSLGAAQKISAAWTIPIQLLVAPYEAGPEGSRRPGTTRRKPRREGASGKAEAA